MRTEEFYDACGNAGYPLELRWQPGYDHSFYTYSSFMSDHIAYHAVNLGLRPKFDH
jgi:S-formylglutathione hydrolase